MTTPELFLQRTLLVTANAAEFERKHKTPYRDFLSSFDA